jgi:ribosome recycling factor
MINQLSDKARKKMEDTIGFLKKDLDSISTGRANPALLDPVKVEAYGNFVSLSQVASISAADSAMIVVQVWDKGMIKNVEKAIINSNLGFNPQIDGQNIRISIPKLSEERRHELVKLAKKYGEDKKIIIRNNRRDILDEFKKREKELGVSKDQINSFT